MVCRGTLPSLIHSTHAISFQSIRLVLELLLYLPVQLSQLFGYFQKIFIIRFYFSFSNRTNPPTWLLILKVIGVPVPMRLFRTIMEKDSGKICTSSGIKKIDLLWKNWYFWLLFFDSSILNENFSLKNGMNFYSSIFTNSWIPSSVNIFCWYVYIWAWFQYSKLWLFTMEPDSNTLSWAAMNTSSIFSSSSGGQFESPVYNGVKYLE